MSSITSVRLSNELRSLNLAEPNTPPSSQPKSLPPFLKVKSYVPVDGGVVVVFELLADDGKVVEVKAEVLQDSYPFSP